MFDEQVFIRALTIRPEDAKRFLETFDPAWLGDARLQRILEELFNFTKKFSTPPNLETLRKSLEDIDKVGYENRLKAALDEIEEIDPDVSMQLYVLEQAKQVSIVRSLRALVGSPGFQKLEDNLEGNDLLQYMHKWLNTFISMKEDKTYDLKQAFEALISERGYLDEDIRIGCGIEAIDGWMNGGLRKKNLGIFLAPTGAGKSAVLTIIAHKIAAAEQKNVWFISNELPINEVSERFLSRVTGKHMHQIMDNPTLAYTGLKRYWESGLQNRLILTEVNRECSTDELEADMEKWISLKGWKPDVLILDYMERMKPNVSGFKRDQSWEYIGAVASDLVRFAKRKNLLIWTAAQTNRGGSTAKVVTLEHGQGSFKHFQEAAAVISIQQDKIGGTSEDKKIGITFRVQKLRHSANKKQAVTLECDLSKMSISNITANIEEEVPVTDRGDDDSGNKYESNSKKRRYRKHLV